VERQLHLPVNLRSLVGLAGEGGGGSLLSPTGPVRVGVGRLGQMRRCCARDGRPRRNSACRRAGWTRRSMRPAVDDVDVPPCRYARVTAPGHTVPSKDTRSHHGTRQVAAHVHEPVGVVESLVAQAYAREPPWRNITCAARRRARTAACRVRCATNNLSSSVASGKICGRPTGRGTTRTCVQRDRHGDRQLALEPRELGEQQPPVPTASLPRSRPYSGPYLSVAP
jgi:hypothetical protein